MILLVTVWVLTLVVVQSGYLGSAGPTDTLRIQLPAKDQCVAVRRFLMDLDSLVSEGLHVGDCTRVLKEPGEPTPPVDMPMPPPVLTGP